MKILAIETSSQRGTVALADSGRVLLRSQHDVVNQHAERLLPMIEALLQEARWEKTELQRVAVGVGPGTFTGIRVGLAVGLGLCLGLGIEGVGVCSLRTVAAGLEASDPRIRVVVRDARRGEFFLAAFAADGSELWAPQAVPVESAKGLIAGRFAHDDYVTLGDALPGLPHLATEMTSEPDASVLALLAGSLAPKESPLTPQYLRGANADKPRLPPSPLLLPRT